MTRRYEIIEESKIEPMAKRGVIVYGFAKCDYGLARDDSRHTGIEHISVTFNSAGDYPSFTHPRHALRALD